MSKREKHRARQKNAGPDIPRATSQTIDTAPIVVDTSAVLMAVHGRLNQQSSSHTLTELTDAINLRDTELSGGVMALEERIGDLQLRIASLEALVLKMAKS